MQVVLEPNHFKRSTYHKSKVKVEEEKNEQLTNHQQQINFE